MKSNLSVCNKTKQWNINCVRLKQEFGFWGDTAGSRAAALCCGVHSSHYPLTWWSSLFHLCLPSSPIHKVFPGSSSRSPKDETSLKTCSCGCSLEGEKKNKTVTCLLYVFFKFTYFTSFTWHPNTFKVVKYTDKIYANENRLMHLLIRQYSSIKWKDTLSLLMVSEPKPLAGEIWDTLSVPHPQCSFAIDSSKKGEEHFHSLPSHVQMPVLSTVLAQQTMKKTLLCIAHMVH